MCSTDSGGKGPCRTGLHSDSSVCDVTFINMDCSPVFCVVGTCSWGPFVSISSLAGKEGLESRVLTPALSLAHCHSGHVFLPAWTSDVSAVKQGLWIRGHPGGFVAALKCHL